MWRFSGRGSWRLDLFYESLYTGYEDFLEIRTVFLAVELEDRYAGWSIYSIKFGCNLLNKSFLQFSHFEYFYTTTTTAAMTKTLLSPLLIILYCASIIHADLNCWIKAGSSYTLNSTTLCTPPADARFITISGRAIKSIPSDYFKGLNMGVFILSFI